jgi:hypothetical protein
MVAIVAGRPTPMPTPRAILLLSLKPPEEFFEVADCCGGLDWFEPDGVEFGLDCFVVLE